MTETDVSHLMTAPVMTVEPDEQLSEVAWAMLEEGIRSIAVIDESCQPVGILTSTDFVQQAADGQDPTEATVGDYMTTPVVTVAPTTSVETAAARLLSEGFNHVPVVDDGVVGILSTVDVLRHVADPPTDSA